jgi:DNA-directed RNA polymerase I, II, and III subunit RPABC5
MIIPIRCMNCGKVLADKYQYYLREVAKLTGDDKTKQSQGIYFDGTSVPNTPHNVVLNRLGLKRICCRQHFLTHIDLIDNI